MRRLVSIVALITLLPATVASGTELEELLQRSQQASYSADQIISCSTPDGVRDAIVRIKQSSGEIHVASVILGNAEVSSGAGGWTLSRQGGVVSSATVEAGDEQAAPLYELEDAGGVEHLGRPASVHRLVRDGVLRAELVFDDATGALLAATTLGADGSTYCQRRFVTFDPTDPGLEKVDAPSGSELAPVKVATALPETIEGFDRLDLYEDEDGFRFAYYSDGFFSFAVFETPEKVSLPESTTVQFVTGSYSRSFTPGQVTYVWETPSGGMALIGDLPPDLHENVIGALPESETPNLFRRWWRRLFG